MVWVAEKNVDDELREAACVLRRSGMVADEGERGGGRLAVEEGERGGGDDALLRMNCSEMAVDGGDSRRTRWSAVGRPPLAARVGGEWERRVDEPLQGDSLERGDGLEPVRAGDFAVAEEGNLR